MWCPSVERETSDSADQDIDLLDGPDRSLLQRSFLAKDGDDKPLRSGNAVHGLWLELLRNNTPCRIDEHAITVAIPASGDVIVILQWRRADHLAARQAQQRNDGRQVPAEFRVISCGGGPCNEPGPQGDAGPDRGVNLHQHGLSRPGGHLLQGVELCRIRQNAPDGLS